MAKTLQLSDFDYQRPEDSPGFLLWQAAMCWQRKINKALTVYELTYTQLVVLVISGWLTTQFKNVYQHQVVRTARIDRMMTSRILASLEKKDYIIRLKESGDARTNHIKLTTKGTEILLKSMATASEIRNDFFHNEKEISPLFIRYMENLLSQDNLR